MANQYDVLGKAPGLEELNKLSPNNVHLTIRGLNAGYGKMEILHNFDLTVSKGQSLCLIGPNGAGKSTILHSIYGFTNLFDGKIELEGDEITKLTVDDGGIDVTGAMAASGAVSGTTGTFSSDVSGVAGSFSGAVSGTTGTFSGLVSCNGGLTVQDGDTFTFDDTAFTTAAQFRIRNAADNANLFDGYVLKA